ncbi:MAG: tRNA lysidine(34) synthetase TilS [Acidobacteriota bacterium]
MLVGCSGGGDSTVLLDLLHRVAPGHSIKLAVGHLNHGWRGATADADAEHVRALAASRGLHCIVEKVEVSRHGGSLEAAARRARLAFFLRAMAAWPADAVALGHSADDQAETVLLNLARGSGLRGLGGMRPRVRLGKLLILRPLLSCRRSDLRGYALDRGLQWREDSSNTDTSFARNRVRLRLMPEFEAVHPGAVDNTVRAATLLREEEAWISGLVDESFAQLRQPEQYPGGESLDLERLGQLPRALQRRLLRRALGAVRGHQHGITKAHIDAVLKGLVAGGEVARDLPGVRLRRHAGRLRLLPLVGRQLGDFG